VDLSERRALTESARCDRGQGDTRAEAIADVTSAIQFHIEKFGVKELEMDEPLLGVFVADDQVAV
jgi:predicted RNase H-like HicB family nuclease